MIVALRGLFVACLLLMVAASLDVLQALSALISKVSLHGQHLLRARGVLCDRCRELRSRLRPSLTDLDIHASEVSTEVWAKKVLREGIAGVLSPGNFLYLDIAGAHMLLDP